jgi:hypothetical protein
MFRKVRLDEANLLPCPYAGCSLEAVAREELWRVTKAATTGNQRASRRDHYRR